MGKQVTTIEGDIQGTFQAHGRFQVVGMGAPSTNCGCVIQEQEEEKGHKKGWSIFTFQGHRWVIGGGHDKHPSKQATAVCQVVSTGGFSTGGFSGGAEVHATVGGHISLKEQHAREWAEKIAKVEAKIHGLEDKLKNAEALLVSINKDNQTTPASGAETIPSVVRVQPPVPKQKPLPGDFPEFSKAITPPLFKLPGTVPAPVAAKGAPCETTVTENIVTHASLLKWAQSQIGTFEEGGANRGKKVEDYLHAVGLNAGDNWCAAFMSSGIQQVYGKEHVLADDIAASQYRDEAKKLKDAFHTVNKKDGYEPKSGDVLVFGSGTSWHGHVAVVESYNAQTGEVVAIGGNNNDKVERTTYNLKTNPALGMKGKADDLHIKGIIDMDKVPGSPKTTTVSTTHTVPCPVEPVVSLNTTNGTLKEGVQNATQPKSVVIKPPANTSTGEKVDFKRELTAKQLTQYWPEAADGKSHLLSLVVSTAVSVVVEPLKAAEARGDHRGLAPTRANKAAAEKALKLLIHDFPEAVNVESAKINVGSVYFPAVEKLILKLQIEQSAPAAPAVAPASASGQWAPSSEELATINAKMQVSGLGMLKFGIGNDGVISADGGVAFKNWGAALHGDGAVTAPYLALHVFANVKDKDLFDYNQQNNTVTLKRAPTEQEFKSLKDNADNLKGMLGKESLANAVIEQSSTPVAATPTVGDEQLSKNLRATFADVTLPLNEAQRDMIRHNICNLSAPLDTSVLQKVPGLAALNADQLTARRSKACEIPK